jgi:hypothetical protein
MARDKRIEIVATAEEFARFQAAAEEAGLSLSAWLRMVALAAAKKGK